MSEVFTQMQSDTSPALAFRVGTSSDNEYLSSPPSVAVFSIDFVTAQQIVQLSKLVRELSLDSVVRSDLRAEFFQFDPITQPDLAAQVGEDNEVNYNTGRLLVTATQFQFQGFTSYPAATLSSELQSVAQLAEHFGLDPHSGDLLSALLSTVQTDTLLDEVRSRAMLVQAWNEDDFEFIQDDEIAEDLNDGQIMQAQKLAFQEVRRSLDDAVIARGNDYLGQWWGQHGERIWKQVL